MKKLRKEQWISFGLFICVLGIVAGCTAFRHFAGAETPQGGGDLNVLAQSEGETQQVSPQVKKSLPRGAGAWLTAGVDFSVKSSAEKARSGIDSVLDRAAEYGAAVVFLDAIRSGEAVQAGSLDTLRYAIGSASAKGFQPVVCVPAADVIRIGKDGITLAPEVLSALCQNYQVEVLLLSGWRELSFEPWGAAVVEKQEALTNAVQQLRSAAEKAAPGIVFGVESSLVWSNEASGTKASYESLKTALPISRAGWRRNWRISFIFPLRRSQRITTSPWKQRPHGGIRQRLIRKRRSIWSTRFPVALQARKMAFCRTSLPSRWGLWRKIGPFSAVCWILFPRSNKQSMGKTLLLRII